MTAFAYEVHDHLLDNEDADPESDEVQSVFICCSSPSLAGASGGTASACCVCLLIDSVFCPLTCSAPLALILHALLRALGQLHDHP